MLLLRLEDIVDRLKRYALQKVAVETGIQYRTLYAIKTGGGMNSTTHQTLSDYFRNLEERKNVK